MKKKTGKILAAAAAAVMSVVSACAVIFKKHSDQQEIRLYAEKRAGQKSRNGRNICMYFPPCRQKTGGI